MSSVTGLRLIPLWDGMPLPIWPPKDSVDITTFGVDLSRVINAGLTINSASTAVITTGTVYALPAQCSGAIVTVQIGGGTDGERALVVITAALSDGEVKRCAVTLPVVQVGSDPQPSWNADYSNPQNSAAYLYL